MRGTGHVGQRISKLDLAYDFFINKAFATLFMAHRKEKNEHACLPHKN